MKRFFIFISSFFIFSVLSLNLSAQYGPQFDNRGFEQWTNRANEPSHWHSGGTADGSYSSFLPDDLIESSTQKRPGSSGTKSVRLVPKEVGFLWWTYVANGCLTNGRMHADDSDPDGSGNYNYTKRSEGVFNTPINQLPDSLSVWVCFRCTTTTDKAQVKAVVHGNADYKIIADGTESPAEMHVATAVQSFSRTSTANGAYTWRRLSIPFNNNGPCTDVRYILFTATTNETPASGSTSDDLFIDDVLLIYNPSLSLNQLASNSYSPGAAITIPFTLTGTMSPENLNASANQVIAQLSDTNGSFNNPTVLGGVTTNSSGSITATVPNLSAGNYSVRVVSTNYPMIGQNIQQISIASNTYTVTTTASPSNGGTVTGGGTFNQGETCTVSASANSGYSFTNWTENGNVVSTNANYTFTVTSDRNLVANFSINTYSITATTNPNEGGLVSGAGEYNHGASCTLTATANAGYTFVKWTKNGTQVSTNASYTFTVTESAAYVAHFQLQSYTITATAAPTGSGTVSGTGQYNHGASCTLTATANTGYTFSNWTENGNVVSTNASYTFTVEGSRNLVANFSIITYTITVSANPSNSGTVSGGGTYNHGQSCTVIATSADGYTFTNWTENGNVVSTTANYTFTVNANRTLVANFEEQLPDTYNINVSPNPSIGGTVSGGGTYMGGEQCTVTATANEGFAFMRWTEDGNEVSTNANYTFTVTGNRTLVANFSLNTYTIAVTANPVEGGSVDGAGTYEHGATCTLTATVNENYEFVNWTKDDIEVSTDMSYTFTVTEPAAFVAHFRYFDNVGEEMGISQIFPNPFTSKVSIKAEKTIMSVSVYDINGRLVKKQDVSDTHVELDLTGCNAGAYLLQVDYGDSRSVHQIMKAE